MQVKDAMSPREKLITASPAISVLEAMNILVINRIGSLIITDDNEDVMGLITSRDLMQTMINHEESGLSISVDQIMSPKLITVNENDQLETAIIKMDEYLTHHILVKDNEGGISGILSSFDIVRENSLSALKIV